MNYRKKNHMMSSIRSIICIMILLLSNVYFVSAGDNLGYKYLNTLDKSDHRGVTLFVGGVGPGNYSTIQDAIDNASNGDIIFVYSGLYTENIVTNKQLAIIGESQAATIIDGNNIDSTVIIDSASVNFRYFTIQNGDYYGLYLDNAHNTTIANITIQNCVEKGIYANSAIECVIKNNTIFDNIVGIQLDHSSRDCIIENNIVFNHSSQGIFVKTSYNNSIQNCSIYENYNGILLMDVHDIVISNNTIINNSGYGIRLQEAALNTIISNNIFYNDEGIHIWDNSEDNEIVGNTIRTLQEINPIAIDDSISLPMDISTEINVTDNDYDQDGRIDKTSVVIITSPSHGIITGISNGVVTYQPTLGYNGTDFFTYTVEDEQSLISNQCDVNILVISDDTGDAINQEQTTCDRFLSIYADTWGGQSVRIQAGTLTKVYLYLKRIGNPTSSIQMDIHENNATGAIVYSSSQPASMINTTYDWILFDAADFISDSSVQYYIVVHTNSGNSMNAYHWGHSETDTYGPGTIYMSIDGGVGWDMVNDSDFCFKIYKTAGIMPVAANDTYRTTIGTSLSIPMPGVLENDHDHDQAPHHISAVLQSDVSNGALSLQSDGSFNYVPVYDFIGDDEFTYITTDGEFNTTSHTVTINVTSMKRYCVKVQNPISPSINNYFYHNNFISGTANPFVFDENNNIWDNTSHTSYGGNYWSNFNELSENAFDLDLNEIYDEPYMIYGGSNTDHYPLAHFYIDYEPTANFSWIPLSPATDLRILFTDMSIDPDYGVIEIWDWDFGDGNSSHVTDESTNVIHQYGHIGHYNVTLTITDDDGYIDSITKTVTVSATPPVANFRFDPFYPDTSDIIQFNDTSTDDNGNISSWLWDFDDGNTSTIENPTHSYADNGTYNVKLRVGDSDGAVDSIIKPVHVSNLPPIANGDLLIMMENTTRWINVLANDSDTDGYIINSSVNVSIPPEHGNATVNSTTGEISYTPNMGYHGSDFFQYQISDDDNATSHAYVSITIGHNNDPPVALVDSYATDEDTLLTVSIPGVLSNDYDPDDGPLPINAVIVSNTTNGTIILNGNGSFSYEPDFNFYGNDLFTYRAYDGMNYSNNATVTIIINQIIDPPFAQNDNYFVIEDTVFIENSPGILSNDSNPDGLFSSLTAVQITNTTHGNVTVHSNGSFVYIPNENYTGIDSFIYKAFNGVDYSDNATVTLNILNVNDPPIAFNDTYYTIEDNILTVYPIGVLENDTDIDSSVLTGILLSNTTFGDINFVSDGSFTYIPNPDFHGYDSFTYQAFDGINSSNIATVSIFVLNTNEIPIAGNDSYTVNEDTLLSISSSGVLINDSDPDSSPLALTSVISMDAVHGSVLLNSDGSFEYMPDDNYTGIDTFTYQAYDGRDYSNNATVTITINGFNDPPHAYDNMYTINEDTLLSIISPGILSNDVDAESAVEYLSAVLISNVTNGSLVFHTNGSFIYMPDSNFNGIDSFTYQAYDGLLYSNIATVTIIVDSVNDMPVGQNDSYTTIDNLTLMISSPGVLLNDSDPDSGPQPLTAHLVESTSNGSLRFNSSGSFNYTPSHVFVGNDSFKYRAYDGEDYSNITTVTITILHDNEVPVAYDDVYYLLQNDSISIAAPGILENDLDNDSGPDILSAVVMVNTTNGTLDLHPSGSFVYTPNIGYLGNDSFTYRAFDGINNSNIASVDLIVVSSNALPIAYDDSYNTNISQTLNVTMPGVLINDNDSDSGPAVLETQLLNDVSNGYLTLFENGSFSYTPNTNWSGVDTFDYNIFDGLNYSNAATVTINVFTENIVPIAENDSYITIEDTILTIAAPGILINDSDPDSGPSNLTASKVTDPSYGYLTVYGNGSFIYEPFDDWVGIDSFTYHVYDGLNYSNIATVNISVNPENDPPIAYNDSYITIEDTTLFVPAFGVLSNDSDAETNSSLLQAFKTSDPTDGSVILQVNGSFIYMPDTDFFGIDSFTYRAFDGVDYSNNATVTIFVLNGNIQPIGQNDSYIVAEDGTLNVSAPGVLLNDSDPDSSPSPITAVIVDNPNYGDVTLNIDGSFIYIPNENYSGMDFFTYQAFDGYEYSDLTFVNINITDINDPPVAVDDEVNTLVNNSIIIDILDNDYDIDGIIDPATVVIVGSGPTNGTINVDLITGNVNYTPDPGFIGINFFNYTVDDDLGLSSNIAMVTVHVIEDILDVTQEVFERGFPIRHAVDGDWAGAQSFTPGMSTLTRVDLYLRKFGVPDFNLTIELRTNNPKGTLIDTVVFTPAEIDSSFYWLSVDFIDTAVMPGIDYFIVIPPAPSGVTTNFGYEWGYAFGNQYTDGAFWFTRDGGGLWRDIPSMYEFTFHSYGLM